MKRFVFCCVCVSSLGIWFGPMFALWAVLGAIGAGLALTVLAFCGARFANWLLP